LAAGFTEYNRLYFLLVVKSDQWDNEAFFINMRVLKSTNFRE